MSQPRRTSRSPVCCQPRALPADPGRKPVGPGQRSLWAQPSRRRHRHLLAFRGDQSGTASRVVHHPFTLWLRSNTGGSCDSRSISPEGSRSGRSNPLPGGLTRLDRFLGRKVAGKPLVQLVPSARSVTRGWQAQSPLGAQTIGAVGRRSRASSFARGARDRRSVRQGSEQKVGPARLWVM